MRKTAVSRMGKTLSSLKSDLSKIRSGRPHAGLLDGVEVDYYGNPTPLNQVSSISVLDATTLGVSPWEKQLTSIIDKAIRDSDLGLNPAIVGDIVRVPMPALTEERRRELTKVVRTNGEEARIGVRNIRRDANQELKELLREKIISEDDERRAQEEIQRLTDTHTKDIDSIVEQKEADLLSV